MSTLTHVPTTAGHGARATQRGRRGPSWGTSGHQTPMLRSRQLLTKGTSEVTYLPDNVAVCVLNDGLAYPSPYRAFMPDDDRQEVADAALSTSRRGTRPGRRSELRADRLGASKKLHYGGERPAPHGPVRLAQEATR